VEVTKEIGNKRRYAIEGTYAYFFYHSLGLKIHIALLLLMKVGRMQKT
jgi:hypothetical protein